MNKKNIYLGIAFLLIVGIIWYLESEKLKIPNSVDFGEKTVEEKIAVINRNNAAKNGSIVNSTSKEQELTSFEKWQQSLTYDDKKRIAQKENQYKLTPELRGIVGYLNTAEGTKIEDFRGKVVLVDFWTYSCINCIRTLPHLVEWDGKYRDKGLVIIGVHTPEFEFEKDTENVRMALNKYDIRYAVVQDNAYFTWRAFENRYWPRKYLIDADGFIRYDHIGEGSYSETEGIIKELLEEAGSDTSSVADSELLDMTPKKSSTPELYAGYEFALPRGQNIGNEGGFIAGEKIKYITPKNLPRNVISLSGVWQSNADNIMAQEDGSTLYLPYTSSVVNAVLQRESTKLEMEVLIDDLPIPKNMQGEDIFEKNGRTYVNIDEPRLYNLVTGEFGSHKITLIMQKKLMLNAFTFG